MFRGKNSGTTARVTKAWKRTRRVPNPEQLPQFHSYSGTLPDVLFASARVEPFVMNQALTHDTENAPHVQRCGESTTCSVMAHGAKHVARTGWPPGLLQDDSRELSRWFAGRLGARRQAREAAATVATFLAPMGVSVLDVSV